MVDAPSAQHLSRFPHEEVTLPLALLPSAGYYACMARYGRATVDIGATYDKRRKETHRFVIADTRGELALTVPIVKPDFSSRPTWREVRISRHGEWWDKHMTALESAYGRTPYFEFYIDRFKPLFSSDTPERFPTVADMAREANAQICSILGINQPDYSPAATHASLPEGDIAAYPQIRESSLGFIPRLSILDLIFNKGPEAPLILDTYGC